MIPLGRKAAQKNVETTLLSSRQCLLRPALPTHAHAYSRQGLPRPARYSTPSRRANAEAFATPASTVPPNYPPFYPASPSLHLSNANADPYASDMHSFLRSRTPYTIVPTPLPKDAKSAVNDAYFTDSPTSDLLAVMDACLHNMHDVRRAKQIFDDLRRTKAGDPTLETRLYNSFIEAYLAMAATHEPQNASTWVEDAWALFDDTESVHESVNPTAGTYTLALLAWLRFSAEDSPTRIDGITAHTPASILRGLLDRQLSVSMVVADRSISSSEEAQKIIHVLSKAAVDLNLGRVVTELGQAEMLGSTAPDPFEGVPEVIPVTVTKDVVDENGTPTGSTSQEIPFNLEVLRKHLAHVTLAKRALSEDLASRQKLLEESVYEVAIERLRRQAEIFQDLQLDDGKLRQPDLQQWMWEWHQKLKERLTADITRVLKEEARLPFTVREQGSRVGPFLSLIKPEKLSLIVILELMRMQGSGGVTEGMKTARALLTVGKAVEMEYKAEMCKKNNITVPSSATRRDHGYFSLSSYQDLHARRVTARKYMEDSEEWTSDWTQTVRVRVGGFLVDRLMDVATVVRRAIFRGREVTEEQPAFSHSYEYLRGFKLGVIKVNPAVSEKLAKENLRTTLHPRHLPMLVKPKAWLNYNEGGYIYNKTSVMRFKDSQEQQTYLKHASALGNVELVFAGLDVLGSTPWRINRAIFDVVLEVWNSGVRLGKMPPAVYDEPEPERPENMEVDQKARVVYITRQKMWTQNKASNHSERCSVNYKIEIARAFLNDVFYMPHNLDFRGRAYPLPPHLNHIGDDLSRGLLLFAEAKPLGERGLRWLKIHLANLYGYDKATFDERVAFVDRQLDDIYDSAENPLRGRGWWQKADDPWQCLSTCMQLKAAFDSPDPLAYKCPLPVHQDGTCNGLQHYAALGGDAVGARQVNLDVGDRPSDVYTYVANMVEKRIEDDLKDGNRYAQLLHGKVSRKVVKQTVMTTVYGVTFIGAREQIEKQLRDRGDIPYEDCYLAAAYIAKKVLQCIGDLFKGANEIMNWLTTSARMIARAVPEERLNDALKLEQPKGAWKNAKNKKAQNRLKKEQMTAVVWTTPLGLPIVQPYRKVQRKQIMTSVQSVYITDPNIPAEVNAQKQSSAFPPNFIHSLDATHMLLTALECRTQGLTFASVHDSYWTHPCDIDQMSGIIRETFIALHSSDILTRLESEFRERYKDYKVPLVSLKTFQMFRQLGSSDKAMDKIALSTAIDDTTADAPSTEADVRVARNETVMSKQELAKLIYPGRGLPGRRRSRAVSVDEVDEDAESEDDSLLVGRFVNLVDILPELPKKGEFDVNKIKSSAYFFS